MDGFWINMVVGAPAFILWVVGLAFLVCITACAQLAIYKAVDMVMQKLAGGG